MTHKRIYPKLSFSLRKHKYIYTKNNRNVFNKFTMPWLSARSSITKHIVKYMMVSLREDTQMLGKCRLDTNPIKVVCNQTPSVKMAIIT